MIDAQNQIVYWIVFIDVINLNTTYLINILMGMINHFAAEKYFSKKRRFESVIAVLVNWDIYFTHVNW